MLTPSSLPSCTLCRHPGDVGVVHEGAVDDQDDIDGDGGLNLVLLLLSSSMRSTP